MWYWNWFLLPTSVNSGNSPCALSPFGKCNFLTYIYMYTLFPSKLTFEYVWLFLGSNGRGKQTCDDNHKTKEGGGEERNAIREEQGMYKTRARDTSYWHLFDQWKLRTASYSARNLGSLFYIKKWNPNYVDKSRKFLQDRLYIQHNEPDNNNAIIFVPKRTCYFLTCQLTSHL